MSGSLLEASKTYNSALQRSMCLRNDSPRPLFLWAPGIRPGMSATALGVCVWGGGGGGGGG